MNTRKRIYFSNQINASLVPGITDHHPRVFIIIIIQPETTTPATAAPSPVVADDDADDDGVVVGFRLGFILSLYSTH